MLNAYSFMKLMLAVEVQGEQKPTKETLMQALQPSEQNPALLDADKGQLLPVSILTTLVAGDGQDDYNQMPPWFGSYALNQAVTSDAPNDEKYNLMTSTAVSMFPGWTADPNNSVGKHHLVCELQQAGQCPEGYQKVYVDNLRPRSLDELKSLLSKKDQERLNGKSNKKGKVSNATPTDKTEAPKEDEE